MSRRRARKETGQYVGHNTPGDGTGFSKLPELECPFDILTDADLAKDGPIDTTGDEEIGYKNLPGVWHHWKSDGKE